MDAWMLGRGGEEEERWNGAVGLWARGSWARGRGGERQQRQLWLDLFMCCVLLLLTTGDKAAMWGGVFIAVLGGVGRCWAVNVDGMYLNVLPQYLQAGRAAEWEAGV